MKGTSFEYFESGDFQVVYLPYGNMRLGMYVFLPSEQMGLAGLIGRFNASNWSSWTSDMHKRKGLVGLPRFKLEFQTSLNEVLTSLGMGIAFDPSKADFTRMCRDESIFISEVKQKTYIEVNEQGTEAAAVTSIVYLSAAPSPQPKPFRMIVDRPFLFVIADKQSGLMIFAGAIVNPD